MANYTFPKDNIERRRTKTLNGSIDGQDEYDTVPRWLTDQH